MRTIVNNKALSKKTKMRKSLNLVAVIMNRRMTIAR